MREEQTEQETQEEVYVQAIRHFEGLYVQLAGAQAEIEKKNEQLEEAQKELQRAKAELAEYSRSLERRVAEQVEEIQRKSRLERYLSPQVVDSIIRTGDSTGAPVRKRLTIMFSDIRGFTDMSDGMEPEETISILNEYLSEMTRVIFDNGGTIDKFLGDGIMIFFGDPVPQEDHALRAVRCAVAMNSRLRELQAEWFPAGEKRLSIGIGISTGYVTVGSIGSDQRREYTVIGNQVNLASRLQGLAAPGAIIVSAATYGLVKESVTATDLGEKVIKGMARPVHVYQIESSGA